MLGAHVYGCDHQGVKVFLASHHFIRHNYKGEVTLTLKLSQIVKSTSYRHKEGLHLTPAQCQEVIVVLRSVHLMLQSLDHAEVSLPYSPFPRYIQSSLDSEQPHTGVALAIVEYNH